MKEKKSHKEKLRTRLFKLYSDNLTLLNDNEIIPEQNLFGRIYVCPICLDKFSEADLIQSSKNPLTLEDIPMKALGGKAIILTCKVCNNTCGHSIDPHLLNQMIHLDHRELIPGSEFEAQIEKDGELLQVKIKIDKEGNMQGHYYIEKNNPIKLQEHITATKKGERVFLVFRRSKAEESRIQLALLKTAYLLAFARYGYAFILNQRYNRIREQLKHPEKIIYPIDCWFIFDEFPKQFLGVPFMIEPGLESIMPTFVLKTDLSERIFGVILPINRNETEEILTGLHSRFALTESFSPDFDPMDNVDYLSDVDAIKQMLNWINK